MADRVRFEESDSDSVGNKYLGEPEDDSDLVRFSSGCTILDCALGGGWANPRIGNVVGDRSTGKTCLMIEACANFLRQLINKKVFPNGEIHYRECEEAFDIPYARSIGFPVEVVDFGNGPGKEKKLFETVEEFGEDLEDTLNKMDDGQGGLYILDSLDPLSHDAEKSPKLNADGTEKGSFGAEKAKYLSKLFRLNTRLLAKKKVTLLIVSQVRDNIGVTFGRAVVRSGGKALDFYCSQVIFLQNKGKIEKTIGGVTRKIGVKTGVVVDKNKVGNPYRECEFPIMFNYGIDDVKAGCDFLLSVKRLDALFQDFKPDEGDEVKTSKRDKGASAVAKYITSLEKMSDSDYQIEARNVNAAVREVWSEIEEKFEPKRKKYL